MRAKYAVKAFHDSATLPQRFEVIPTHPIQICFVRTQNQTLGKVDVLGAIERRTLC